jgi:hypothetical protein
MAAAIGLQNPRHAQMIAPVQQDLQNNRYYFITTKESN